MRPSLGREADEFADRQSNLQPRRKDNRRLVLGFAFVRAEEGQDRPAQLSGPRVGGLQRRRRPCGRARRRLSAHGGASGRGKSRRRQHTLPLPLLEIQPGRPMYGNTLPTLHRFRSTNSPVAGHRAIRTDLDLGGATPRQPIPFAPELAGQRCDYRLGRSFVKACHPNVMMINAIDAQHFNSVHHLPVHLNLEPEVVNENCIIFRNATRIPPSSWLTRLLGRFYQDALTYTLSYWFGSTGSVTIGPDFLHFHIIFALRPSADGRSEGQTIFLTRHRDGLIGKLVNRALLMLTRAMSAYFAKGDTLIFKTIRFNFRTPIKADLPIIRFIQHVERQPALPWGLPVETTVPCPLTAHVDQPEASPQSMPEPEVAR